MKQLKDTKTEETETAGAATPVAGGPSKAMLALFKAPATLNLAKAKRMNLPPLILPKDIPVYDEENQAVLVATVVKGCKSPASTVKGKCIWIKLPNGDERLLPCTGAIRSSLVPGTEADSKDLVAAIDKLKGRTFAFKRLPNTMNARYKKEQYIFDVFELES